MPAFDVVLHVTNVDVTPAEPPITFNQGGSGTSTADHWTLAIDVTANMVLSKNGTQVSSVPYNAAALVAGVAAHSAPTVGDLLLDGWFEIDTGLDGTTPNADFGTFVASTTGIYAVNGSVINVGTGNEDTAVGGDGYLANANASNLALAAAGAIGSYYRLAPGKFTDVHPLKLCVSTTGATDGASTASAAGVLVAHLLIRPV